MYIAVSRCLYQELKRFFGARYKLARWTYFDVKLNLEAFFTYGLDFPWLVITQQLLELSLYLTIFLPCLASLKSRRLLQNSSAKLLLKSSSQQQYTNRPTRLFVVILKSFGLLIGQFEFAANSASQVTLDESKDSTSHKP